MTSNSASGPSGEGYPGLGQVLVVVPTYNEAENVRQITARLRAAVPEAHLLIADDNSPDGTGKIADELVAADDHVHVLHRPGKQGLGGAYIAGFRWALERDYEVVVEMDADGSHAPEELPRLLNALRDADLVLGSRWVPGGKVVNWPKRREALSRGATFYTRMALGLPVHDATAGFRAYRREVLQKIELDAVVSQGYCFQIDLSARTWKAGFRIVEVPITFAERERGQSKMSSNIIREAFLQVAVWGVQSRAESVRRALRPRR